MDAERQRAIEIARARARLRAVKQREMTHFAAPPTQEDYLRGQAAQTFGVPPSDVNFSEPVAGPGYRFVEGASTDTVGEQVNFGRAALPGRVEQVGDFVGVQDPNTGQVGFTNLPGADWGDVAGFGGGAALPVATGLAVGTRNPWIAAGAQVGLEAAREGLQAVSGIQDESPLSYGARIGLSGAGELAPYAVAKGIGKVKSLFGKGKVTLDLNEQELVDAALAIDDFGLPALMQYQKTGSPVVKRLASQILQLTDAQRPKVIAQLQGTKAAMTRHLAETTPVERLPEGFVGPPQSRSPDAILQQQQATEFERRRRMLQPPVDPAEAGQALGDVVRRNPRPKTTPAGTEPGGLEVYKSSMDREYDALRAVANPENGPTPIFDVSRSRAAAAPRQVEGVGAPRQVEVGDPPTLATIRDKVNVAEDAPGRVRAVRETMARLDDTQTDFEVLKELRSELGKYYNRSEYELAQLGVDKATVDKLYGALSKDMAPVNAADVPEFVARRTIAEGKAKEYYGKRALDEVRMVLNAGDKGNPERLWRAAAQDPVTWSKAFRELIEEGDPKRLAVVKKNLGRGISGTQDPVATIERFRKENPAALTLAFGDARGVQNAYLAGKELKGLNSGLSRKAFDATTEKRGFALMALKDRLENPAFHEKPVAAATRLVRENGGPGSSGELALRNAALETVYRDALKINPQYDVIGLEPKALAEGIEKLKTNGWWDGVLTKQDRDRMTRLQTYTKRAWEKGDAGTALTIAGQVGKLRGSSGLSGMAEAYTSIRASQVLATLVTAERTPKEFLYDALPYNLGRKTARYAASRPPFGQGKFVRGLQFFSRIMRQELPAEERDSATVAP